ncbi:MAG: caspase family protein [Tannerella sp.]|jgi:hypothetical protein|nr:caspase family protein [Tannerella sp.]
MYTKICTLFLCLTVYGAPAFPLQAAANRALIVAIGAYPAGSGWDDIHALNDCRLIVPALKANGYRDADIRILPNEKATKEQITSALKRMREATRTGDYIYIHFSGHGQQMADDNGDEPDGLDEAFIPYDAAFRYMPGIYEGENHLRDDELEALIDAIRRRAGESGNVTVLLDACHSGTGTRDADDDDYMRGTAFIFAPPGWEDGQAPAPGNFHMHLKKEKGLSPVTVFSACQPDEVNYEYKTGSPATYYGCLSYFFCLAIREADPSLSIRAFYFRLQEAMNVHAGRKNRKQTPFFESTHSDNRFGIGKP